MSNSVFPSAHRHTFIVRIWWEPGLTLPSGRPLWRGRVQHAVSGKSLVFQSLDDLLGFIQSRAGDFENAKVVITDRRK